MASPFNEYFQVQAEAEDEKERMSYDAISMSSFVYIDDNDDPSIPSF